LLLTTDPELVYHGIVLFVVVVPVGEKVALGGNELLLGSGYGMYAGMMLVVLTGMTAVSEPRLIDSVGRPLGTVMTEPWTETLVEKLRMLESEMREVRLPSSFLLVVLADTDGSPEGKCELQTEDGISYSLPSESVPRRVYDSGKEYVVGAVVVVLESGGAGVSLGEDKTLVLNLLRRSDVMVNGQIVVWRAVVAVTTATLCWTGQFFAHGGQPRTVMISV
jgi:hypothetical protein